MQKESLVSIIIPCYNGEKYLRDTLKSVLWQTYSHWECILIDDGSSDKSEQIFSEYAAKDKRFRYFKQNNSGPTVARNYGIDVALGGFIQFLDADDVILPKRLELCLNAFNQNVNTDVVYTDYMTFQSGQGYSRTLPAKMPYDDPIRSLLFENNLTFVVLIHTLMFKKNIIKENKFDTGLHSHAEDVECWARMAIHGVRFSYLDEVLSIYRYTFNSLGSDEVELLSAKVKVLEQYRNDPKCSKYVSDFESTQLYLKQRLAIAHFMKRSFSAGIKTMNSVWNKSTVSSKVKMLAWGLLMIFFSKNTIAASRAWIVKNTPLKWGAWKQVQIWTPTIELKELLGE